MIKKTDFFSCDLLSFFELLIFTTAMAFMRVVSILIVLMHLYWYCYGFFLERGWTLEVINKILGNFQRMVGLFSHTIYTKIFALVLLALSCLGTKGVKNEKITIRPFSVYYRFKQYTDPY